MTVSYRTIYCPKNSVFHLFIVSSLPTEPLATTDLFTASKALPFQKVIELE